MSTIIDFYKDKPPSCDSPTLDPNYNTYKIYAQLQLQLKIQLYNQLYEQLFIQLGNALPR